MLGDLIPHFPREDSEKASVNKTLDRDRKKREREKKTICGTTSTSYCLGSLLYYLLTSSVFALSSNVQITRKIQNKFGSLSESMEKIINLAMWEDPDKTLVIVKALGVVAIALVLIPFAIIVRSVQVEY